MSVELFDSSFYALANSDLSTAGLDTIEELRNHFFQLGGINENRLFSPVVNLSLYASSNPDLGAAGVISGNDLYNHLSNYGVAENRSFSYFYNSDFYRSYNNDLTGLSNEELLNHFQNYGINEGRRFSAYADLNFFRAVNPELRKNDIEPSNDSLLNQLVLGTLGINNTFDERRLSISYDPAFYRAANPDLASLNTFQLFEHFQFNGSNEYRASSDSYNPSIYINNNQDLAQLGFTPRQELEHFEIYGFIEGRKASDFGVSIPANVEPGNDFSEAYDVGLISQRRSGEFKGTLDQNTDFTDVYSFTLANTNTIDFTFSEQNGGRFRRRTAFDANGDGIYNAGNDEKVYDSGLFNSDALVTQTLGSGSYFIIIDLDVSSSPSNANYTVKLSNVRQHIPTLTLSSSPPFAIPDARSTISTAFPLKSTPLTFNDNPQVTGYVGFVDKSDIYRFSVSGKSSLGVRLDGTSKAINISLRADLNGDGDIDDFGENIISGNNNNNPIISLNTTVDPGIIYYLVVSDSIGAFLTSNTNYALNLQLSAV